MEFLLTFPFYLSLFLSSLFHFFLSFFLPSRIVRLDILRFFHPHSPTFFTYISSSKGKKSTFYSTHSSYIPALFSQGSFASFKEKLSTSRSPFFLSISSFLLIYLFSSLPFILAQFNPLITSVILPPPLQNCVSFDSQQSADSFFPP